MFDIGWTELLILAIVAILVVGPKELPRMLRTIGNYAGKMRRMANEFRSQFDEAIREAELDDVRSSVESIRDIDPLKDVKDSVSESLEPLRSDADDIKRKAEAPAGGAPAAGKADAKTKDEREVGDNVAPDAAKKRSAAAASGP